MNLFMFVLFTIVVITVGVLTVYFTAPKPSMLTFKVDFDFETLFYNVRKF
jgi:hypothetical protein